MSFHLQDFIDHPSFEKVDSCRKEDLLCIAAHFNISIQKHGVKRDIKKKILEKLIELKVLVAPSQPRAEGSVDNDDLFAVPSVPPILDGKEEQAVQATPQGKGAEHDAPPTLPRFEPFSPESHGSSVDARLKVRLARLQLEAQEKERGRKAEYDLRLQVRRLEIEADKEVQLKKLEVEAMRISSVQTLPYTSERPAPSPTVLEKQGFDVSKSIALVPTFRESEVDSYFSAFEKIATALNWPKDMWPILLQCKLVGKAQEVVSSLSLEASLKYAIVKESILRAYELVPEAYRQKFRNHKRANGQTFVEFAREKGVLFDKWCSANEVKNSFESLRQLLLLEDFKGALPERMVMFLNDQKVTSLPKAAVLADEFVLTHKSVFVSSSRPDRASAPRPVRPDPGYPSLEKVKGPPSPPRVDRECFYCHRRGHVVADCLTLKRKQQHQPSLQQPKGMGLIKGASLLGLDMTQPDDVGPDPCFKPFIIEGFVSLTEDSQDHQPVKILRDTGGSQTIIREGILPLSPKSSCNSSAIVQGIGMSLISAPMHNVYLQSPLVSGSFKVAVLPVLPIKGVDFILSNDLAGGKVMPVPEVLDAPDLSSESDKTSQTLSVFPACVVTRAQAKKYGIDLSVSFLVTQPFPDTVMTRSKTQPEVQDADAVSTLSRQEAVNLPATRKEFIEAQQGDATLTKCHSSLLSQEEAKKKKMAYILDDGLLMRRWTSDATEDADCSATYQVVVPTAFRPHVLNLAHDHPWSGHMGVTKTYDRVLKHFFWPGLKADVVDHCRTCHVCQVAGKPNQVIPPAPLCPIPVMGEPFERVIVDCVGPMPKTKGGNQFLLTIMCASTRFPEAIPLRRITAPVISKALLKFFSVFGLPKVIQTDQGTNFKSKVFAQVLKTLSIKHVTSSPYHPESQGALERFHQTMKAMLRKFCFDSQKDWDDGVPFVLFAAREAVQESLGFSPMNLVFGHQVRGPLKVLKEQLVTLETKVKSIPEYVAKLRDHLQQACSLAKDALTSSQVRMKKYYDKRAVAHVFHPGDKVLILSPIPGSALSTKFCGPYTVERKINETNYVIRTPDRRRRTRACHVNMMKPYLSREDGDMSSAAHDVVSPMALTSKVSSDEDELVMRNATTQGARLSNSQVLSDLPHYLSHLPDAQRNDVENLICDFQCLFSDIPSQTSVITHDIVLTKPFPIKQHAYRVNPAKREIMRKETDYLVMNGFAVPSSSPWSSPCLLDTKSDGSPRFCTDFRKVGQGQVCPADVKITAIAAFPVPTTRRELRRFLGMAGYYRRFCKNFSSVSAPLTALTSPSKPFVWTPECQQSFESLKGILCCNPVLSAPDFSLPFKLEVDASAVGAGAVLLQEDDQGIDHPVSYFSRKFNKQQLKYSTIEKEALALLFSLQHFEVYLGSSVKPIKVFTDHNPLVFLSRMYNHNQRLMRWSLIIQNYNLEIYHKRGSENVLADALSRAV
ncbi:uncharacterized protein LOC115581049 isoform X3 [Sparus aurata]|uniref:uncharacterized protein LOC115581049 isoform X3 n=1 Tax=Sparus aurata TaxID=8175 RepID=UPI0011C18A5E|nr:uncharacterized protein LOC115581049 isoform X3 [Sparus aurata]